MASRALAVLLTLLTASVPAFAQKSSSTAPAPTPAVAQAAQQKPPAAVKPVMTEAELQKEKEKKDKDAQTPKFEEQVVVTASKVEQQLGSMKA